MILTCPFCSVKVSPSHRDCPKCARRMSRRCPACAEDIAANAPQCKYCGEEVKGGESPLRVASPTPGIEFIEDSKAAAPAKRKRCCGKGLALLLLAGLAFSAFAVRADCVACVKSYAHQGCISTKKHPVSHCERRVCRYGKTPLWVTVYEKMGGQVRSCKVRKGPKAPSPDASAPVKNDGWH